MGSNNRLNAVAMSVMIIATMLTVTTGQSSYCNLCANHTLCIYPGVSSQCSQVLARGVGSADQQTVVAEHNRLRNYVASGQETKGAPGPQPAASDMLKMRWDSELATVAQRWADQCAFGHDQCRSVPRYPAVSQNAFLLWTMGTIQGAQWNNAAQYWYNEVKDFNKNDVNSYRFSSNIGHYSQVVWANTRLIGCGYTAYKKDGWNYQYYVCNYAPHGNYEGQRVYKIGRGCSACPSGCDSTYTSLCA